MKKKKSHYQPKKISIEDALKLAITVHQGGNPTLASEHYRAILGAVPDHADAMHYLGIAQHQLGKKEVGQRLIARALEIAPDYVDARNNLGNMQKESGQFAEAEQSYRAVLEARPDFIAAHNNLGVALKSQGRLDEAVAAYRQAVTLAPDFLQGWLNLGNAWRALGDEQESLTAYQRAILLDPDNVNAHRNLGRALVAFKREKDALEVYRQWQRVEPDNPIVAHLIAACEGTQAPERASDDFVQQTFDRFANSFDSVLAKLDYRAPGLCGEMVAELLGTPAGDLDVLDAGCGTGLCAPYLRSYARHLHGVDLSPGMLAKAAERTGYDALDAAELTAWLDQHRQAYDLVVSADTLCYFGALDALLQATATSLRSGGHFVFTVEETLDAGAAPQFQLHPHGRYSHTEAYVRQSLESAGMPAQAIRRITLRNEAKVPVAGLLVLARV